MSNIQGIFERKGIEVFLETRGLLQQYTKAKGYLLQGLSAHVRFKQRNPKEDGIWYFRVNKQFRALCVFHQDGNLIVFKIDNHQ